MVGAGRRGGAAGAAASAPRGHADRRSLRRAGRKGGRNSPRRGAEVTTVDRSAERLKLLAANFERLRLTSEIVVADALTFDAPPFDAVLLDAPCTATGTIRRHPDVAWIKRPGDLAPLVKLQAQLIDKAIALTRPGGAIVYCVCSLEPEEGEAQIARCPAPQSRRTAVRRSRRTRSAASPSA